MLYMEQTYLAMIKGSDPEEFILVTMDAAAGNMKHMSEPFSEEDFRNDFSAQGMQQAEIQAKIAHARANPV